MNEAAGFPDVRGFDTKDKHREESLSGPLFIGVNILPAGPVYLLVKIYILLWTQPWKQKNNHPSGICVICTRNHEITTSSVFLGILKIYMYEYTLVTEIMLCIKIIHFCLPVFFFVVCKQMYANGKLNLNSLYVLV